MNELKICPFCGEYPRTEVEVTRKGGDEDHVCFSIHCPKCGTIKTVRLKIFGYCSFDNINNTICEVIEKWNRRVGEKDAD